MSRAVVLFSGGFDSSVLLFHATKNYDEVLALTFDYGQANREELYAARVMAEEAGVQIHIEKLNIPFMPVPKGRVDDEVSSYIPNRNLLFITLAHNYATLNEFDVVLIGILAPDFTTDKTMLWKFRKWSLEVQTARSVLENSDPPHYDSRREFFDGVSYILKAASDKVKIDAPFLDMDKVDIIELAHLYGIKDYVFSYSVSCNNPIACGQCSKCLELELADRVFIEKNLGTIKNN